MKQFPHFINQKTPCSRVLLEKVTYLRLIKKFLRIFRNQIVYYRTQKSSPPAPILSQIGPFYAPHPNLCRYILILFFHPRVGLPSVLFPSGILIKTVSVPLLSSYVPHVLPIPFFLILSPELYLVSSTDQ